MENSKLEWSQFIELQSLLKGIKSHLEEQEILKKQILSFNEACKYMDVSDSWLYKRTSSGEIEYSKPNGGKLYFSKESLDNYMLQETVKSNLELEEQAEEWIRENQSLTLKQD